MRYGLVFCFSGQGSHYYKMGKELYDQNRTFRTWMDRLDEIARPIIGQSVVAVLYNEKAKLSDCFDRLLITHPAIFMFEYSLYQYFAEKKILPDYVLGASLGEFVSAAVSGILEYEDLLKIVIKQADIVERTCERSGMMALFYRLEKFNDLKAQYPDIELASINSENHFVISGSLHSLEWIEKDLRNRSVVAQILAVSHAFHSRLIDPAAEQYKKYLESFEYGKPSIPYFSCVTGTRIDNPDHFKTAYFWDVCRKPIQIREATVNMEKQSPFVYIDIGPSGTFANLIKQNLDPRSGSKVLPVLSPFGKDSICIEKAENALKIYMDEN